MEALEQLKAVYEDKKATINERDYEFKTMTHKQRRSIFAYYTKVAKLIESGDFSFLDTQEFNKIESLMFTYITYNGIQLSKQETHFDNEEFEADYVILVATALGVISYPFLRGKSGF